MLLPTYDEEERLHGLGHNVVAGVDEVGRGPLAGPVVAAAVVFPQHLPTAPWLSLVRDSKTLSSGQRERVLPHIQGMARGIGVGLVTVEDIDKVGIVAATRRAMALALDCLSPAPAYLLVDALSLSWRSVPCQAIVKGDATCLSIAAASIVAKVTRDRLMEAQEALCPGYGFARHKGYSTPAHREALRRLGPCPLHRRSFAPVRELLAIPGEVSYA